jgi:hypothetical protein
LDVFKSGEFLLAITKDSAPNLTILNAESLKILREITLPGTTPWDVAIRPRQ